MGDPAREYADAQAVLDYLEYARDKHSRGRLERGHRAAERDDRYGALGGRRAAHFGKTPKRNSDDDDIGVRDHGPCRPIVKPGSDNR